VRVVNSHQLILSTVKWSRAILQCSQAVKVTLVLAVNTVHMGVTTPCVQAPSQHGLTKPALTVSMHTGHNNF